MGYVLCAVGGLAVGAVVAWLIVWGRGARETGALQATVDGLQARGQERDSECKDMQVALALGAEAKVQAETRLRGMEQRLDAEKQLLEEAKSRLTDTFKALAGDALKASTQGFLQLAGETLEKVLAVAKGDFGQSQEAIRGLVGPLNEALKRYEEHIRGIEGSRKEAYGNLAQQLREVSSAQEQLRKETGNLVQALRTPQVRGRWGELTLRRTVELAGLSAHCDFTEQVSVQSDEGGVRRPDLIVHLPAEREIVVDAKVPLLAYLAATEADGEEAREKALSDHARQFRKHMADLRAKAYWEQFPQSPAFVVMFVPGESFLAAAVDVDRSLIEDGMSQQVVVATPTTLVALLWAVAHGWRQERIAEDAQEVAKWGRDLYERMVKLNDYVSDIGKGLEKARDSYNEAVGSLERMVLPAARRFKDLGAGSDRELSLLKPVEVTLRAINTRSLPEGGQ